MIYTKEVENMCPVAKGAKHEPAPIPEEGKWVHSKKIEDISGFTHGVGWCAPQQGACKLSLNVKNGIIEEALVETIGCSGMTHSAAMAAEVLQGKTILEALNTDLVCDAINTATLFFSSADMEANSFCMVPSSGASMIKVNPKFSSVLVMLTPTSKRPPSLEQKYRYNILFHFYHSPSSCAVLLQDKILS